MLTPAQQILRLGFGFAISQALRVVADLGVADLLAEKDRSVEELAAACGANAGALYRLMRLLASEGVFDEVTPRQFAQTETSAALRADAQHSPRDFVRMINSEPYQAFAALPEAARTGGPTFERVFGASRFDWLHAHNEQAAYFQRAMVSLSGGDNEAVAAAYDFTSARRVVDVGGGHGQLLSQILARNPHLQGVLMDTPTGIQSAKTGVGGPLPGVEFVVGDFFEKVPQGADVYVLKRVIHDWPDERAAIILRNCRAAMASGGVVLVAERIIGEGSSVEISKYIDVLMLAVTGGVERNVAEFSNLFAKSGLILDRVIEAGSGISVLAARAAH